MPKVRRANVILTVDDNELKKYLARGYDILDSSGEVLQKATPRDINSLTKAYVEHIAEIKSLKEKIMQLEKQLAEKTELEQKAEKPKRTRQTKSE